MPRKLINVSNRLPVTVGEQFQKSSGGLVAALEALGDDGYRLSWIGWPGAVIEPQRHAEVERILREEHRCIPVFLSEEQVRGHYEGFSNSSLWPLLHYMPGRFRYEAAWWDQYEQVNRSFAEKVLEVADDGDLVWVHDYQLMRVPALLREAKPSLRIGFFLHTPFPAPDVFRLNPKRTALVEGMLGADQIGFHTFGYLRHFQAAVRHLLGLESTITEIRHQEQSTVLGIYPIGINAAKFTEALNATEFENERSGLAQAHAGQRLVLSVERMDYTKGILERLDAVQLFLERSKDTDLRDRVRFMFISVPSREGVEEYKALREEIESRVGRLNGTYATLHNIPIQFIHGSVTFYELCALYALAEIALITPLIDGMNLVAKEYVACQRDGTGVLVLSEFAGAAEELFNALLVNPYDAPSVVDAMQQALTMPAEERRQRMAPMRERVMRFDARWWAKSFIADLGSRQPPPPTGSADAARQALAAGLASGRKVALFLDYDGTLREIERDPEAAGPTRPITDLLDRLAANERLDMTIISGRTPADMERFLGGYAFGLVAEHGATFRRPGVREWEEADRDASYAWMDPVRKVLQAYVDSTPGSFIEEKRTGLVWHYRKADPEFGEWKARLVSAELAGVTANAPVHVRHGRKIVEIASDRVSKASAILRFIEGREYSVIFCAGDDQTDESMFRLDLANLLTMKIGSGDTLARYRLASPAALRKFLLDVLG